MKISSNNSISLLNQGARFIVVGGITASIDFLIFYVLVKVGGWNYLLASAIGFLVGSSLNYELSVIWVFKSGRFQTKAMEYGVFILFTFFGLLINQLLMFLQVGLGGFDYRWAKAITIVGVTIFNFITKKRFVFLN